VECVFKFLLVSVGVLAGSFVPLVIFFVGSGIVIVVLEWLDLDIGKPHVEGGQASVASTKGGNEKDDSARRLMKSMRVDYGVGVADPTELEPGQRRDGAYMRSGCSIA